MNDEEFAKLKSRIAALEKREADLVEGFNGLMLEALENAKNCCELFENGLEYIATIRARGETDDNNT